MYSLSCALECTRRVEWTLSTHTFHLMHLLSLSIRAKLPPLNFTCSSLFSATTRQLHSPSFSLSHHIITECHSPPLTIACLIVRFTYEHSVLLSPSPLSHKHTRRCFARIVWQLSCSQEKQLTQWGLQQCTRHERKVNVVSLLGRGMSLVFLLSLSRVKRNWRESEKRGKS